MNERFHTPPHYDDISEKTPLVFLAGPIQGSPDWQTETAQELLHHDDNLEVASPRRVSISEPTFDYNEQVAWEKDHLARSAKFGTVVFWFAAQDFSLPIKKERAYAQTSRIEIGRMFGWYDHQPFNLIVGVDPKYRGGSDKYIATLCAEKGLPVLASIDDIIDATLFMTPDTKR